VLVLADADGLGVDLDQLRQGVHQPPADGHRAAHGQVEIGKLAPRRLGGRVDRSPALVHEHDRDVVAGDDASNELLGFPAGIVSG